MDSGWGRGKDMKYLLNGQTYDLRLEHEGDNGYIAFINGERYSVTIQQGLDGAIVVETDAGRASAYVAMDGEQRYVQLDGVTYRLTADDGKSASKRRRSGGGGGDLTAQMPGQVVDVLVAVGDVVQASQTLLVLEAMKMEIRVNAPHAGVITQVAVARGDVVERGQPLIELGMEE
jgi:biotin carboxyl carrier protein